MPDRLPAWFAISFADQEAGPSVGTVDPDADDFLLSYAVGTPTNTLTNARVSNHTSSGVVSGNNISGSFTAIPEPTGVAFLLSGVAAVMLRRRR
ncbi:PEP-CTERM sorting domain-containing protein [Stieleria sp. TO1_6]|uniref:PEP-CTERM sorting domain-containing protein n=1 Tax=Stieleria tagensis TaxID=2956795 RepID=UPI00209A8991|nr:PEP-CTERM sorting domain-containing protein [Stieleria tagensis]MCO8123714.1 PEP-CTERM sorting domain-containing protein [Stieleria tagensis]